MKVFGMFSLILFPLLGLLFALLKSKYRRHRDQDRFLTIVLSTLVGLGVGFAVSAVVALMTPRIDYRDGPYQLVAMRGVDGVSGAFILGSGSIGVNDTYHIMVRNDDGTLTPESVAVDDIGRIKQDPALNGVGYWSTIIRRYDRTSAFRFWAFPDQPKIIRQDFEVPEGSVVQQFKID